MFENMTESIEIELNCSPRRYLKENYDLLVYTGKIDEFFKYKYGWLEYRSLKIQFETSKQRNSTFQLNECNSTNAWTRSVDHSHWHKQKSRQNNHI